MYLGINIDDLGNTIFCVSFICTFVEKAAL
nr:MAG TPA: hypothetical protein [Caudoviricetes sp.]